jgi:hypothetical protein
MTGWQWRPIGAKRLREKRLTAAHNNEQERTLQYRQNQVLPIFLSGDSSFGCQNSPDVNLRIDPANKIRNDHDFRAFE